MKDGKRKASTVPVHYACALQTHQPRSSPSPLHLCQQAPPFAYADRLQVDVTLIKKEIDKLNNSPPILIKISPDLSNTELKKIIKETVNHKLHGLIISNTTIKRNVKSKYKEETGGLSGEPLFQESTKVLIMARKILNDFGSRISIIATGGVYDGKSAYIKILCGADLIQLYTGMVYEGPFVVKNILDQLNRFRKRDKIKNWEDVRGLAKSINEANKIVENGLNKKT